MKIIVLHNTIGPGASADEHDNHVQAEAVENSLKHLGHETGRTSFCYHRLAELQQLFADFRPDAVFNLVEEVGGDYRLNYFAPLLLEAWKQRYTGCPYYAVLNTTNKITAKRLLLGVGVGTAPWTSLNEIDRQNNAPAAAYLLKPVSSDASQGIDEDQLRLSSSVEQLSEQLQSLRARTGFEWFAEAFIDGREFNVSVLEIDGLPRVLPPAEILFEGYPPDKPRIVGYRAKWVEDSFEYQNTPRTFSFPAEDDALLANLRQAALKCWHLFGLRGYARVDCRVGSEGEVFVLEVNANPCISPESGFIAAAGQAGIDYQQVIARILEAAFAR